MGFETAVWGANAWTVRALLTQFTSCRVRHLSLLFGAIVLFTANRLLRTLRAIPIGPRSSTEEKIHLIADGWPLTTMRPLESHKKCFAFCVSPAGRRTGAMETPMNLNFSHHLAVLIYCNLSKTFGSCSKPKAHGSASVVGVAVDPLEKRFQDNIFCRAPRFSSLSFARLSDHVGSAIRAAIKSVFNSFFLNSNINYRFIGTQMMRYHTSRRPQEFFTCQNYGDAINSADRQPATNGTYHLNCPPECKLISTIFYCFIPFLHPLFRRIRVAVRRRRRAGCRTSKKNFRSTRLHNLLIVSLAGCHSRA